MGTRDEKNVGAASDQAAGAKGAARQLPAEEVSAFCEGVAAMLAAGIQTDEALALLADSMEGSELGSVCADAYELVAVGSPLAEALAATGAFPAHALDMLRMGERSGRTEAVLSQLAGYYAEEHRVLAKIRATVGYPATLLCVMSVILAFTVAVILPVFIGVYENMAGSLTAGSGAAVGASVVVGWVALAVTLVAAVAALAGVAASRTVRGQAAIVRLMERFPATREAMYQLALSRFSAALACALAAGSHADHAMSEALSCVGAGNAALRERAQAALDAMEDPERALGLAQAISESGLFEPAQARMLEIGSRVGSTDEVLDRLSGTFFDEAVARIDRVIDATEPALAAFMTTAVGATLVSVMLPLIGIMGSVG